VVALGRLHHVLAILIRRKRRVPEGATRFLFAQAWVVALAWSAACASPTPEAAVPSPAAPAAEPTTAYYTAEQATRGQRTFTSICSTCHGRNEFTGPIFGLTWRAEPVGNLFEHVSTNMPQDDPGSLTPQQYADVVAYILQMNGLTAGDRELPPDPEALRSLRW
jgi:mono/diheme cytochrome c family protein